MNKITMKTNIAEAWTVFETSCFYNQAMGKQAISRIQSSQTTECFVKWLDSQLDYIRPFLSRREMSDVKYLWHKWFRRESCVMNRTLEAKVCAIFKPQAVVSLSRLVRVLRHFKLDIFEGKRGYDLIRASHSHANVCGIGALIQCLSSVIIHTDGSRHLCEYVRNGCCLSIEIPHEWSSLLSVEGVCSFGLLRIPKHFDSEQSNAIRSEYDSYYRGKIYDESNHNDRDILSSWNVPCLRFPVTDDYDGEGSIRLMNCYSTNLFGWVLSSHGWIKTSSSIVKVKRALPLNPYYGAISRRSVFVGTRLPWNWGCECGDPFDEECEFKPYYKHCTFDDDDWFLPYPEDDILPDLKPKYPFPNGYFDRSNLPRYPFGYGNFEDSTMYAAEMLYPFCPYNDNGTYTYEFNEWCGANDYQDDLDRLADEIREDPWFYIERMRMKKKTKVFEDMNSLAISSKL